MRVNYNSRLFDILSVINVGERNPVGSALELNVTLRITGPVAWSRSRKR